MADWERAGHWSYTGNPADSDKDRARWLCGDVDDSDKQVSDEEINAAITDEGSPREAAAAVCEHLAAKFAREAQKSVGAGGGINTSVSLSERSRAYAARAKELRSLADTKVIPGIYAGGTSQSSKDTVAGDSDRIAPGFYVGMFDAR